MRVKEYDEKKTLLMNVNNNRIEIKKTDDNDRNFIYIFEGQI